MVNSLTGAAAAAVTKATLTTARNTIAKLCCDAKMKNSKRRIPRNMLSNLVAEYNKKHRGLGLTNMMVSKVMGCLYYTATSSIESSTEEESESDTESP